MTSIPRNGPATVDCATVGPLDHWRSQHLIEILPAAVYVCDAAAVIVAYNRRAAELWGREPVLGDTDEKYCGAHRLFRPDGTFLPHHETPMQRVLQTGEPARDLEVVIERPDGSRITVLANIAPLHGEDDQLVGAVNCFQDLTVHKQEERERIRLAEELHQAKKIYALGRLTAGVAHDFNNLLTAILGNLELLKDRVTDEGSLKFLRDATRSAQLGSAINAQLLSFARRQTLRPEAVDLNRLVAGMGDLLRTTVGDSIQIETHAHHDVWPALVDPNQIALVILNLVINARDAMPSGGALTIETRNATLPIRNRPENLAAGDYLALSISDTGIGMSEEVRARAFEPFFTTKGAGDGSGLGLSMVLGVAEQSGGGVRIDSQPGRGTSVEILLPRAGIDDAAAGDIEASPPPNPAVAGEVVLVVDDNGDVREVTAAMVSSFGYNVLEANSGLAALAILGSGERVDLMLVDIAMPAMNGIEVVRRARQQRPSLPVLFATGYGDAAADSPDDIERSGIVCKPYRRDELCRMIQARMGAGYPSSRQDAKKSGRGKQMAEPILHDARVG